MRIARPPAPRRADPIVPLIDVVFFLLVFFMLVGRMDATAPFEVQPPDAISGSPLPAGGTVVSIARDGALALDGVPLERDALAGRLGPMLAENANLPLRINAHRETALRHVLPVMAELEALGAADVALVVTPPGAERP